MEQEKICSLRSSHYPITEINLRLIIENELNHFGLISVNGICLYFLIEKEEVHAIE